MANSMRALRNETLRVQYDTAVAATGAICGHTSRATLNPRTSVHDVRFPYRLKIYGSC